MIVRQKNTSGCLVLLLLCFMMRCNASYLSLPIMSGPSAQYAISAAYFQEMIHYSQEVIDALQGAPRPHESPTPNRHARRLKRILQKHIKNCLDIVEKEKNHRSIHVTQKFKTRLIAIDEVICDFMPNRVADIFISIVTHNALKRLHAIITCILINCVSMEECDDFDGLTLEATERADSFSNLSSIYLPPISCGSNSPSSRLLLHSH